MLRFFRRYRISRSTISGVTPIVCAQIFKPSSTNIMFVLEGLKICAQTIGVTPEMVDREILYIFKNLSVEE